MKPIILPALAAAMAIAYFVFWPTTVTECISKGSTTSLPWLECKK